MRKSKIQVEAEELVAAIKWHQEQLEELRNKCTHKKATQKDGGSTGYYDPTDDCDWTDNDWPECGKRWRVNT